MKKKIFFFLIFGFLFFSFDTPETGAIQIQGNVVKPALGYQIQPANATYYGPVVIESSLTVNKPAYFPAGVHIGKTTGEGGVTFLNGTIVNASAGDQPVIIGDDLRVDGKIIRYNNGQLAPVQIKSGLFLQGDIYGYKDLITFDDNVKIKPNKKLILKKVKIEGLSINTPQIADDAITSEKIKDGAILGSDISSSTSLNVRDIELSGEARQSSSRYGLVKAVAYVLSGGGVKRSWNSGSQESITVEHEEGSGVYELNFHWNVAGRYFQVTPVNENNVNITANFDNNSQIIDVYTWCGTNHCDSGFMITIY